ncbi:phosphoribosylanthranilate isomerase [Acidihalobacter prosperus]|uniref:N-(5'-phosphoribosyl)anthranilate isomerase n=1 Tax=Acidihalobacter prosperus TaxID=160660 RepID=A0A1A6C2X4_9GAMM|nr:phosphoribosylanthranilate isomerase [Acidihalobacter prosperus]OBS08908.1 N-(5'-phosphoribosyl)anthranilate isomerase [Acidihalobacter prosperus]
MRTRIKICGITRLADAQSACEAGVDALGFVFYPRSPRHIAPALARDIVGRVPPFVTCVGLFLDAAVDEVREIAERVGLDVLQFHGNEPPEVCRAGGRPYLKAVGMQGQGDPISYAARYEDAQGFLLDSHGQGEAGGTGRTFDWAQAPVALPAPIILAGGLKPENVGEAVVRMRPYAVDVSSGVESAPGVKDASRIMRFVSEVRRVDAR